MNVRRLAIELLEQGDRAGADGSLAIVIGLCLFHGREDVFRNRTYWRVGF